MTRCPPDLFRFSRTNPCPLSKGNGRVGYFVGSTPTVVQCVAGLEGITKAHDPVCRSSIPVATKRPKINSSAGERRECRQKLCDRRNRREEEHLYQVDGLLVWTLQRSTLAGPRKIEEKEGHHGFLLPASCSRKSLQSEIALPKFGKMLIRIRIQPANGELVPWVLVETRQGQETDCVSDAWCSPETGLCASGLSRFGPSQRPPRLHCAFHEGGPLLLSWSLFLPPASRLRCLSPCSSIESAPKLLLPVLDTALEQSTHFSNHHRGHSFSAIHHSIESLHR